MRPSWSVHHKEHGYESDCGRNQHHNDKDCGCGHHDCGKKHQKHFDNCVEDVLAAILKAQRKVKNEHECKTSCKQSIDDLLGEKKKKPKKNTIPFILYCNCKPFKGTGVSTYSCHHSKNKKFKCVETYVFKIKDLKGSCAVLELLTFKSHSKHSDKQSNSNVSSPCQQIDHKCVNDLMATGICINVDLSCFCAVTCLDAVYL